MCENDVKGVERSLNSFNCYSMLLKLKESKVVFAAFTQHCVQSYSFVTHVERVESVLCIQWPLAPVRREGCSPLVSPRRQLC